MSASKPLAPVLLVLGGIAIGAGAMWYLQNGSNQSAPASAPPGSSQNSAGGTENPVLPGNRAADERPAVSILSEAVQTLDRDKRMVMLRALAENLVQQDIKLALEIAANIPNANDKLEFLRALFAAWAAKDPKAAADYARANFKPGLQLSETIDAVVATWATRDPRAAQAWIEANTSGPLKEEALGMFMQGWTRVDPTAAAAWFVGSGSTSDTLLGALIDTWGELDPRAAAAWVESLANLDNKRLAEVMLAGAWAAQNPGHAAAYFTPKLQGDTGMNIGSALVNAWGAADPAATAEWISTLPADPVRNEFAATLATIWAASDIEAAVKWSEKLEDVEMKAGVIDHLGTTWGAIEPEKALAWIGTLPDDDARTEATKGAFNSWAATDPPGLAKWIELAPAGLEADLARIGLGEVQIEQAPAEALKAALGINDPDLRSDAVAKFFRLWRRANDAAAQKWLQGGWSSFGPDLQARLAAEQQRPLPPR